MTRSRHFGHCYRYFAKGTVCSFVKFIRLGNDVECVGGDSHDAPNVETNVASLSSGRCICKDVCKDPSNSIHVTSQHKHEGKSLHEKHEQKGIE